MITKRGARRREQPAARVAVANRLLPDDAYPCACENIRDDLDGRLRGQQHLIPTAPGRYRDRAGDLWTLDDAGRWTDHKGRTRAAAYTPMLGGAAPFTKVVDAHG